MKVIATKCLASDLKDGDIYSPASQKDWDLVSDPQLQTIVPVLGHMVYVRSNSPCPDGKAMTVVYRLSIIRDDETPQTEG